MNKRPFNFCQLLIMTLIILLSSCDFFGSIVSNNCSKYNDDRDDFRMSFVERSITIPLGETRTIQLNRSWLNDDLVREQLNCDVNEWEYEPDNIVMFDEEDRFKLTALSVGTATVRAIVTGGAGIKTAELIVTVIEN